MKNNKNKNANRFKSKEKARAAQKPKGYYYSAANINKRKELQKKMNNNNNNNDIQMDEDMNDCSENFVIKKNKNNLNNININNNKNFNSNNNLELYNKNNLLLNYIQNERKEYSIVLNKLKLINYSIGHIILKPKIKNFEINKKLIREKEKREQEELNFNKTISDKIEQALNNANLALDNIRYLGKPKNSKPSTINNYNNNEAINNSKNNYNYYEYKREKEKNDLLNLAQKCLDKYVEYIQINNSNHDEYFITISKRRKLFKDAKEQLQSCKYRLRNSSSFFDDIFKSKIDSQKINTNTNQEKISLSILSKEIFFKENIFIRVNSFLKSEIFQKLFVKVLYNDNFIENPGNTNKELNIDNNINNNDIYNIFSLWIIIKELINLIGNINNNNNISLINRNINEKLYDDNNNNLISNSLNNYFFKKNIFDVVEKYLNFLNRKNNNSINFDENQIFSRDYHKFYEICFKLEQSKIAQYIMNNIENNNNFIKQNIISNTKEELNYFRNIQSIFVNKGKYICSIINK